MARMFVGRSSDVASAKWSRKPGPSSVPNAASPSLVAPPTKSMRRNSILAVRAHVVADDERAVRPADEHGPLEPAVDRGWPRCRRPRGGVGVVLRLERRLGHAVTAKVVRDEPELVRERALELLVPAEMALRQTMDEHDRRSVRLAPLAHVQQQAAASAHGVSLHPSGRRLVFNRGHHAPPHARRIDTIVAAWSGSASGGAPYLSPPGDVFLRGEVRTSALGDPFPAARY